MRLIFILAVCACLTSLNAQTYSHQNGIRCQAEVVNNTDLLISWDADTLSNAGYFLYRRFYQNAGWGPLFASIPAGQINYLDTAVTIGQRYEYKVMRNSGTVGYGYTCATVDADIVYNPGRMALVIDDFFIPSLNGEIDQLISDLNGDGWFIDTIIVNRLQPVTYVKDRINTLYTLNPTGLKSIFLFGHVPVPYSGDINPDGHPDHLGAWPADVYYGDMDGVWTDNTVNDASASDPRNQNVIGDGKFDASVVLTNTELAVARVDFYNLPSFNTTEIVLMQNYLNKLHEFKIRSYIPEDVAVIEDNFLGMGEGFAGSGYASFPPIVGIQDAFDSDYGLAIDFDNLWSYGTGPGSYSSASGIVTTPEFASYNYRSTFTMLFGSYFGDWDSQDNLLRAALASGKILCSSWSGRPYLYYHPMGIGETIGACIKLSQNNTSTYFASSLGYFQRWVHIAQMGDPSLRSHYVEMPSNLVATTQNDGSITLSWTAPPTAVDGFYVYRHAQGVDSWTKLTNDPILTTTYADTSLTGGGNYTYMVRSVRTQTTGSGRYCNQSLGTCSQGNTSLNIENLTFEHIMVWPNPIITHVNIKASVGLSFSISDALGRIILKGITQTESTNINAQYWEKGMYLLNIGGQTVQLIKQ